LQQEEMKHNIGKFVLRKSFCNKPEDIPKKFLFALIELGHPSEVRKKGESEEEIAEELMDVIFRGLDDNRHAAVKSIRRRCWIKDWRKTLLDLSSTGKVTEKNCRATLNLLFGE